MIVEKKGLIFSPDQNLWWQQYYAILPTPILLDNLGLIRVFFSTTCANKYGRLTYIDLDYNNPLKVINISDNYILDVVGNIESLATSVESLQKPKEG